MNHTRYPDTVSMLRAIGNAILCPAATDDLRRARIAYSFVIASPCKVVAGRAGCFRYYEIHEQAIMDAYGVRQ